MTLKLLELNEEFFSIRAVAKENMSKGGYVGGKGISARITPLISSVTQNEIAKIAQVSPATVARYDVVMKSDEEDLKEQMKKSELSQGTTPITKIDARNEIDSEGIECLTL